MSDGVTDIVARMGRPRQEDFVCPCGYQREVSVPAKIALASWLADYPCPACAYVVYPRPPQPPPTEESLVDDAVRALLMALAEPGVTTVADIRQRFPMPPDILRQALGRVVAAGLAIPDGGDHGVADAAFDTEAGQGSCPACDLPGITNGWCEDCAQVRGWHP